MPPLKSSSVVDKVPKKPRHRHSPHQLAALNALYEQTEHPTLVERTALAQSLGLEIKSVNAYFQNKRASAKKQPRGSPYGAPQRVASHSLASSTIDDDYYYPPAEPIAHNRHFRSALHLDQDPRSPNQLSPTDPTRLIPEPAMPSQLQQDELQKIYHINPYPTLEESKIIAQRIGMRYQTIVDWFRAQRNSDRRSIDDYPTTGSHSPVSDASARHSRLYPILPPISTLPPATSHPSLIGTRRLSFSVAPQDQHYATYSTNPRSSSPRNDTPYGSGTALSLSTRQRRGRPDPFQLNSLRRLLSKTPTPSIEERSALALEIGMDLGKVTNWFRNLRQSTRKRQKKLRPDASDDELEYNEPVYLSSTSCSRSETPSVEREAEYAREQRERHAALLHSSDEDEDAQEAVTPSPSPSPGASPSRGMLPKLEEKPAAVPSGSVPYEDALLLLSFHRQAGMF
ncbi:homeodomain transcription factor [Mycena sanguinolenta]|nr:homeodomain transcription factor [Mycena sanguinolenta]